MRNRKSKFIGHGQSINNNIEMLTKVGFKMAVNSPVSLGYRMPAEWEQHEATWISWPKDPETFPGSILKKVEDIYCEIVGALSSCEKVKILVNDKQSEHIVIKKLEARGVFNSNVLFYRIKSVDVWTRDYLPSFVLNSSLQKLGAIKWKFNAWGNKYTDLLKDDDTGLAVAKQAVKQTKGKVFRPNIVLEGGSIDVDGKGLLLTTEQCLLNKNRNPRYSKQKIEKILRDYLGVSTIIWLKNGIEGDDTDGHIDDFCRFVPKNKIVIAQESINPADQNYKILKENLHILEEWRNSAGHDFEIFTLTMPAPVISGGRRLPASYANFYIANKVVLLPVFGCRNDSDALGTLAQLFDNREIIAINATELIYGYGGIHCVTQQEPKVID